MSDPFIITGPTVLANSGGKTSGYNEWRHLEANGGTLPDCAQTVFTNTGWEKAATLDFLAEQERRWGVEYVWLEFCYRPATAEELCTLEGKWQKAMDRIARFRSAPAREFAAKTKLGELFGTHGGTLKQEAIARAERHARNCFHSWRKAERIGMNSYRRVSRATASTDGRPFNELLEGLYTFRTEIKGEPGVLPNGTQRICTARLKMGVSCRFARDLWNVGPGGYEARLGLRADEEERITSAFAAGKKGHEAGRPRFPLDEAGITKADVAAFWSKQGWGLAMRSHEGNCGGCHMKRRHALIDLIRRDQFDPRWWAGWEVKTGQRFRLERSYAGLVAAAKSEQEMFAPPEDYDNAITCETGYCTD